MQLPSWTAVALSATSYGLIFPAISNYEQRFAVSLLPTQLLLPTIIALCALRYTNWSSSEEFHHDTSHRNSKPVSQSVLEKPSPGTYLDDTHNPLIAGPSKHHHFLRNQIPNLRHFRPPILFVPAAQPRQHPPCASLPISSSSSLTFKLILPQGMTRASW